MNSGAPFQHPKQRASSTSESVWKRPDTMPKDTEMRIIPKLRMGTMLWENGDGKRLPVDDNSTAWGIAVSNSTTPK